VTQHDDARRTCAAGRHRWSGVLPALVVLAGFALAAPAAGAPGDLDRTFSRDGKQTTDFGRNDQAHAVALQPDGRIVVAGRTMTGIGGPMSPSDFAVARYRRNGSLDPSFSVDGKLTSDFAPFDDAWAVVVQPDGKIVVAGTASTFPGAGNLSALVRYNADGSLDDGTASDSTPEDTFGVGGRATLQGGSSAAIALQPNGQIVMATGIVVARFNPDGWLDPGFGAGGTTTTTPIVGSPLLSASAVALEPDGQIVAAGYALESVPQLDFGLARFNVNGPLDGIFSVDGRVTTDLGASDLAHGVAVQPDGKIVAAGESGPVPPVGPFALALARYNPDGSLDDGSPSDTTELDSFGSAGKVTTPGIRGRALALQPDGKIVVAGLVAHGPAASAFVLARYSAHGSLDASFAGDGIQHTGFPFFEARGVVLQPNGNIVVAGLAEADFAVARYVGNGTWAAISALQRAAARTTRALRRAGIRGVLRQSGAKAGFSAPTAGTMRASATTGLPGGRATAARRVTVLAGRRTFAAAGKGTIKLKLTRRGRGILERAKRTMLRLDLAFVDAAGTRSRASRIVRLRR